MKFLFTRHHGETLARIVVAGVFIWTAAGKAFANDVPEAPHTVFERWVPSQAMRYAMAAGELVLAAWLLSGKTPRLSAIVLIVAMSAFSGFILLEFMRDQPQPCGCTGTPIASTNYEEVRRSLRISLIRNGLIMGVGVLLFLANDIVFRPRMNVRSTTGGQA